MRKAERVLAELTAKGVRNFQAQVRELESTIMSLLECSQCHCVENTALCNYNIKDLEAAGVARVEARKNRTTFDQEFKPAPALCSECDPKIGKWHGQFPRENALAFWNRLEDKSHWGCKAPPVGAVVPQKLGTVLIHIAGEANPDTGEQLCKRCGCVLTAPGLSPWFAGAFVGLFGNGAVMIGHDAQEIDEAACDMVVQ